MLNEQEFMDYINRKHIYGRDARDRVSLIRNSPGHFDPYDQEILDINSPDISTPLLLRSLGARVEAVHSDESIAWAMQNEMAALGGDYWDKTLFDLSFRHRDVDNWIPSPLRGERWGLVSCFDISWIKDLGLFFERLYPIADKFVIAYMGMKRGGPVFFRRVGWKTRKRMLGPSVIYYGYRSQYGG